MRYKLYATGPDNHSTFADCFGPNGGPGRLIAEAAKLAYLVPAADSIGHRNWHIRDAHRREWISPADFQERKCVQAAKPPRDA
jgi:hypothetical protein